VITDSVQHGGPPRLQRAGELWPRNRMVGSDYLYYLLVAIALGAFLYYLYSYREQALLYLPQLLSGTLITLVVSVLAAVLAIVFGLVGAFGSLSRWRPVRWLVQLYVEVVRGTPLLVQLLLWYFGVRLALAQAGFDPYRIVFQLMTLLQNNSLVPDAFNSYFYGVIALSFNYGAYMTEVFRSGIAAVDRGQREAAISLGLDARQTMRYIILPQAVRAVVPALTNNFITLIQDSAFLSAIAVVELEYLTAGFALPQLDPNTKMFVFVLGALLYLALCYPLSLLTRRFERMVERSK
jgi:amine acid ABC transporter, permease protein, 3-TM region, His/Glu/Gln/Arg/opine family